MPMPCAAVKSEGYPEQFILMADGIAHHMGPDGVGSNFPRLAELASEERCCRRPSLDGRQTNDVVCHIKSEVYSKQFVIRANRNAHYIKRIGLGSNFPRLAESAITDTIYYLCMSS